jgi:hypothetical protein
MAQALGLDGAPQQTDDLADWSRHYPLLYDQACVAAHDAADLAPF